MFLGIFYDFLSVHIQRAASSDMKRHILPTDRYPQCCGSEIIFFVSVSGSNFQEISDLAVDPDPTQHLSKEAKAKF